jgi:hypothetical protein
VGHLQADLRGFSFSFPSCRDDGDGAYIIGASRTWWSHD